MSDQLKRLIEIALTDADAAAELTVLLETIATLEARATALETQTADFESRIAALE